MSTGLNAVDAETLDEGSLVIALSAEQPEARPGQHKAEHMQLIVSAISTVRHELEEWLKTMDASYKLLPAETVDADGKVKTSSPVLQLIANAATLAAIKDDNSRPPSIEGFEPLFEVAPASTYQTVEDAGTATDTLFS